MHEGRISPAFGRELGAMAAALEVLLAAREARGDSLETRRLCVDLRASLDTFEPGLGARPPASRE